MPWSFPVKNFFTRKKNILSLLVVALLLGVPWWLNRVNFKPVSDPVSNEPADEAEILIEKASENYFYREFPEAAENYRKAIVIYEQRKDSKQVARIYESLGDLHKFANEIDEAEANYLKAADVHSSIKNFVGEARALKDIGDLHLENEESLEWYKKALAVTRDQPSNGVTAEIHEAMGRFYWKQENIPQAVDSFTQARDAFAEIQYQMGYEHMANILQRLKKHS